MIVGSSPESEDVRKGYAFSGSQGWELDKIFQQLGVAKGNCFLTLVLREQNYRPVALTKTAVTPEHVLLRDKWVVPAVVEGYHLLLREIEMVQPTMIIALGDLACWALTGNWNVSKWRGSMLYSESGVRVLPTYSLQDIFMQWKLRPILVQDIRRAFHYRDIDWPIPQWNFITRPSFGLATHHIGYLIEMAKRGPTKLSVDIETRAYNLACLGISHNNKDAICIPFMELGKEDGYWSETEEAEITFLLYQLLTHPNVQIIGQNFIYDAQYIYRAWHFIPHFYRDTMLTHHTLFPGMQKSLDFICSFHNRHYVYWKDDGKQLSLDHDEDKHWRYNCEDCVRTFEADEELEKVTAAIGREGPNNFQQELFYPVLDMMTRGVRIDYEAQKRLQKELKGLAEGTMEYIHDVVGWGLNPNSPKQMAAFFYEEMKQPKIVSRTTQSATCDSAALMKIAVREPLLLPLVEKIEEYRSYKVYLSHFLEDKRDKDGRLRCSYNIAGTKTFRFSSSEDPFGSGYNLQTVPSGDKG